MEDIKWIKLATCMPDDEKMKLIDAMKERDTIHYVWIRILLLGGKLNANGEIFLSEGKPLTANMLAILFSRPIDAIKLALRVLSKFGMIEIAPNKVIRIVNWDKYQNIEGMERVREQNRKRAETHREKKKWEKKAGKSDAQESYEGEVLEESITLNENEQLEKNNNLEQEKNSSEGNYAPEENKVLDKNTTLENLETREEASVNTDTDEVASDINAESANNEDISNNIVETDDNNCTVTKNKSNVTVTQQNKKEKEKKNKKEKKEIDKDRNTESKKNTSALNNKSLTYGINNKNLDCDEEVSQPNLFDNNNTKNGSLEDADINSKAMELMQYHEKITGKPGSCEYVALR